MKTWTSLNFFRNTDQYVLFEIVGIVSSTQIGHVAATYVNGILSCFDSFNN